MAKDEKGNEIIYFAAKPADELANAVLEKATGWFNELSSNGYLDKLRMMWAAYHGAYYTTFNDAHTITFAGEQGELANMSVNHLGNIAEHMINMITAVRPTMQARSVNRDYKSVVQTKLANGLLDYYTREKRLENYLKEAVRYAVILGSGYIKMEWNATSGEAYDFNEDLGVAEYEGDIEFSNLSQFDVVFDPNREDNNHDWVMTRSFKNKHDLAAKYPEFKDKIQGLQSKRDVKNYYLDTFHYNQTDLIPVYEFYHKRSEALPDGRYMLFLSKDITLLDGPMPYRTLPVYRLAARNIMGTPYGYSPLFDILPIQDAINSLYSTVLSNQSAFGVQNIFVPRGADVSIDELSGGLNMIEGNTQFGEIRPLQLTNTPKEVFDFMKILEQQVETISGINSVTRGNPDPNLRSGNAMALVQSMAIQFMSGLQQSYVAMIEDVGTGIIQMLQDYASVPRVAMIVGRNNKTYMQEFKGDDLSSIRRVIVDIGNPLSRTTAGRVEMAEQMLQMGVIKTPEQYFAVVDNGRLDEMTDDSLSQLYLAKQENEKMIDNGDVIAIMTDQHDLHIKEHSAVLADPDLRFNPQLVQKILGHVQEHVNLLKSSDPNLLMMLKQQPIQAPPNQSMQGQVPDTMAGGPTPTQIQQTGQMIENVPSPATPPAPVENLPTNPANNIPGGGSQ